MIDLNKDIKVERRKELYFKLLKSKNLAYKNLTQIYGKFLNTKELNFIKKKKG